MKKLIALMLIVGFLSLSVTGCGDSKPASGTGTKSSGPSAPPAPPAPPK